MKLIHSESSSVISSSVRSTAGINFFDKAYSISAKWQNIYWSGICIEYAL